MGIRNLDGWTLAAFAIFIVVLAWPIVLAWNLDHIDAFGVTALVIYEGFAIKVFRGLVYPGHWHTGD